MLCLTIWKYILAITIAAAGGVASQLNENGKNLTAKSILARLFVNGYIGLMVMLLCTEIMNYSGNAFAFFCGLSGWIGTPILDRIAKKMRKMLDLVENN